MATTVDVPNNKSEKTDYRIYDEIPGESNRESFVLDQNQSYDNPGNTKPPKDDTAPKITMFKTTKVEKYLISVTSILFLLIVFMSGLLVVTFVRDSQLQNEYTYQRDQIQELKSVLTMMNDQFQEYKNLSEKQFQNVYDRINLTIVDVNQVRYLEEVTMNFTNLIKANVDQLTQNLVQDMQSVNVFESCAALRSLSLPFLSGMYQLRSNTTHDISYCSMEHSCNGTVASWKRVTLFDINTLKASNCPNGLLPKENPNSCIANFTGIGCTSVIFPVSDSYLCVLGRINGYQAGTPDGFLRYSFSRPVNASLDENYADGVSLTHGSPRTHIWTFTAGSSDSTPVDCGICYQNKPSYIKMDYSCDVNNFCPFDQACIDNVLWDDEQCFGSSVFYKQLPHVTGDDIEMRICRDEDSGNENILFTAIEIYVQ